MTSLAHGSEQAGVAQPVTKDPGRHDVRVHPQREARVRVTQVLRDNLIYTPPWSSALANQYLSWCMPVLLVGSIPQATSAGRHTALLM